jgi:hypothetical protein
VGEAATRVSARRRILAIRRFWIVVLGEGSGMQRFRED